MCCEQCAREFEADTSGIFLLSAVTHFVLVVVCWVLRIWLVCLCVSCVCIGLLCFLPLHVSGLVKEHRQFVEQTCPKEWQRSAVA